MHRQKRPVMPMGVASLEKFSKYPSAVYVRKYRQESQGGGEFSMLRSAAILLAAMALLFLSPSLASAQNPVQDALEGCSNELQSYCSNVTPGGGRLVSCAKAHVDKLSPECISAINRAGYWVQFLASTLQYVVTQCAADALKFCPDVELGEERVLNCLASNRAELSKYCGLALQDIGK